MKLERITLENFRQYYGRQRLEFSKDEQRNVTIIHGVNGAGKTSLFLALNWCLYGRTVDNVTVIENVGELISKEAISRTPVGEKVRASVELSFLHNAERYIVRRALEAPRQTDGSITTNGPDEFVMMRIGQDGQAVQVKNPLYLINSILPANVREYFLFDGEKIDNFAKPDASDQVKQAIYLVLKLEVLDRARRRLGEAAREYRKELKQTTAGELHDLLDQDEKARDARDAAEKRIDELNQEIASARAKIKAIEQKLNESQNAQVLQQQRERLARELKGRQTELANTISQIRDVAVGAYLIVAQPAIEAALRVLDAKRERGEIPSSIRQQFVHDLIERGLCICGRCIEAGSSEQNRLEQLMRSSLPGSLENDVLDTSMAVRTFAGRGEQQITNLQTAMQQRIGLISAIDDLDAEIQDIGRQLKDSPLEEISRLEEQRRGFVADIDSNLIEIGSQKSKIEDLGRTIIRLESAIAKARKEQKRDRLLSKKIDMAQRASDAIAEVYAAHADDMRTKIEAKTKDIFKMLVWKESHFHDVQLGPDYNLDVIDRYGSSARPELSAGERQVLSLSFITAMSRISEEEAPLVMDTPFGRLSSHHRNSITMYLPQLANQLVLFVTDEELRDEARENLNVRIGAEYRLHFNPNTSCTEILEGK